MVDNPNFNVNDESTAFLYILYGPTDIPLKTSVTFFQPTVVLHKSEEPFPEMFEVSIFTNAG